MKLVRLIFAAMVLFSSSSLMAQEPSKIVVVEGKKCLIHTVVEGDTFYSLAKHYDVPLKQIIAVNGEEAESLVVGAQIYVPYNDKAAKISSKEVAPGVGDANDTFINHVVAEGDTFYSVAKYYKISLDQLLEDNPDVDVENMALNTIIKVRTSKVGYTSLKDIDKDIKRREKLADEARKNTEPKYHNVVAGETLYSLARRYKTTEEEIMRLNGFTSTDELLSGMTIIVRGAPKRAADDEAPCGDDANGAEVVADSTIITPDSVLNFTSSEQFDELFVHESQTESMNPMTNDKVRIPSFRRVERGATLNVVAMLAMHQNGKVSGAYVDFYRGMLLALEDLRRDGYSINLTVLDTQRSVACVSELICSDAVQNADLIIGPSYEPELAVVLPLAEELGIPVVSPLIDIDAEKVSSPNLFQMRPDDRYKYEKYAHLFDGSHQIYIVFGTTSDMRFAQEIADLANQKGVAVRMINAKEGRTASFALRNADGTSGAAVGTSTLVRAAGKKAIFIVADKGREIVSILNTLGESIKSMVPGASNECTVVGHRNWDNLTYTDREGYFNAGVSYITPYNAKHTDNDAMKVFESRFLATYGLLPTPYSCRGYDAMMLFATKMFTGLDKYILLERITPLATPYQFKFEDGMFINAEWVNTQFMRDFTVSYK